MQNWLEKVKNYPVGGYNAKNFQRGEKIQKKILISERQGPEKAEKKMLKNKLTTEHVSVKIVENLTPPSQGVNLDKNVPKTRFCEEECVENVGKCGRSHRKPTVLPSFGTPGGREETLFKIFDRKLGKGSNVRKKNHF